MIAWCTAGIAYVIYMFAVDVPMYWNRWAAGEAVGRTYLELPAQGSLTHFSDASSPGSGVTGAAK